MTLQTMEAPISAGQQRRASQWDKSAVPARMLVPAGVEKPVFHVAPRQGWVNGAQTCGLDRPCVETRVCMALNDVAPCIQPCL